MAPTSAQVNAVSVVRRDEIARPGGRASDHVARRIDDARGIARRTRRLDRRPRPSRCPPWKYSPLVDGPMTPIWLPRTWLPDAPGIDQHALSAVAADDVGVLRLRCHPPSRWPSPARSLPACCPARPARPCSATAAARPSASRPGRPGILRSSSPGSGRPHRWGSGIEMPTPNPSTASPRMMLCEVASDEPGRAAGLVAVQDHADLCVVAVDRRGRVGNGRDQRGVADRNLRPR